MDVLYKSNAVIIVKGHMNSWGPNLLQQGAASLETSFSPMSETVYTCNAKDKTNSFSTVLPILLSDRDYIWI